MRRPFAHLASAAAVLAVAVAISLRLGPLAAAPATHPSATSLPSAAGGRPGQTPDAATVAPPTSPGRGSDASTAPVALLPVSAAEATALQAAVDRARSGLGLGAVAVGISADERVGWSGASGPARDGKTPLSGATPFAIASVTKTFTAAIVLQLVEEGRIGLDVTVTDYLPEVTLAKGVTVEQLLRHTSGIADLLDPMRSGLNAEPSRVWTPAEVLARVGPSLFVPGSAFGYSNTNYVIAGMLVERVTGNPFADELERRITGRLGLVGTGFPPANGLPNLLGVSWASAFWTSAALDSDATDLVRWGDALYGGDILKAPTLAQMLEVKDGGYGMGAERYTLGGMGGYGHSGLLRGYTTFLIHLPDAHLTLAVLATGHTFSPTELLTYAPAGKPSILSLAQGIAVN